MQAVVSKGGAGLATLQHCSSSHKRNGVAAAPNAQPGMHLQRFSASKHSACCCSSSPSTSQRVAPLSTAYNSSRSTSGMISSSCSSSGWPAVAGLHRPVASKQLHRQRMRLTTAGAAARTTAVAAEYADKVLHSTWTAPCGTVFEVMELTSQHEHQQHHLQHQHDSSSNSSKPPVVLIHGLFRAAWYWTESLMPLLAAAGHDSYAISLRGQGTSQLIAAAAASDQQLDNSGNSSSSNSSNSKSSQHPFTSGVPLTVNVADIGAFICSRGFSQPPILIGHSLGGMFVQEYLLRLIWQQQQEQQQLTAAAQDTSAAAVQAPATPAAAAAAALPHIDQQLPQLSGAVLLASATAGTVMSFGRFIADVGVLEFLYQMYIVLSHAHLNNIATARYCWWQDELSQPEAERHLAAIRNSSSVLPYITSEVGGWYPPAPTAAELAVLPPVLALGGAVDRIIRPFQVCAAGDYWGADVRILDGVTHDVLLGPQALGVSEEIVSWLEALPSKSRVKPANAAAVEQQEWQQASSTAEASVGRLV